MPADPDHAPEAHPRATAGHRMVTALPRVHPDTPVSDVLADLHGTRFETAEMIFVTAHDGRLEGVVSLRNLLADGPALVGEIMQEEHEAVRAGDDQEDIARLAMRLNMIAVPVVDDAGRLIGAVPPEALFAILHEEHMEDLQKIAGIQAGREGPHAALDATISNRIGRRLPWLVFGLAASALVTLVMVEFEHALAANVAVAFFVPALVYIAGAIGTQAVSVSVRGLATHDVVIGKLLRDELVIGLAIGGALGALAGLGVFALFADLALSLAVALAVLGGGVVSAVVGFALPWAFERLGADPALGSGPVCTVIQDAASLVIYFIAVSLLVL